MSSIHLIFGLPWFLTPATVPCMISFSRQSSFLITWPKYYSFLLLIKLSRSRSTPAVSNTHSFISFCVHYTLRIIFVTQGPKARRLSGIIYGDTSKNGRGVLELAVLQFNWCSWICYNLKSCDPILMRFVLFHTEWSPLLPGIIWE